MLTYCPKQSSYHQGINFIWLEPRNYAFDANSEHRWYSTLDDNFLLSIHTGDKGAFFTFWGSNLEGDVFIAERNLLGKFLRIFYSPYGVSVKPVRTVSVRQFIPKSIGYKMRYKEQ